MVEKIEFTSQECEDYVWFAKQCLHYARMTKKSSVSAISNGDVVVICKYTPVKAILIVDSVNFYCHPKSSDKLTTVKYYDKDSNEYSLITIDHGGWLKKTDGTWYPLDARLAYSLVDDDAGTFSIKGSKESITAKYTGSQIQNYGNIYWYSKDISGSSVLSWKGPPSIQFPIDPTYSISGLTQSIRNTNSVYTTNIYKSGKVFCQALDLVVGACYTKSDKGKKYLLSFVHFKEDNNYQLRVYKSTDSGKSWVLIKGFDTDQNIKTPVFISKSGRQFIYKDTFYKITDNIDNIEIISTIPESTAGTQTVVGKGGYESSYTYKASKYCWPGLDKSDNLIKSNFTVNASFSTIGASGNTPKTKQVPIYRGNPATNVVVTLDNSADPPKYTTPSTGTTLRFKATTNGVYCKTTWSGVDCFEGLNAIKTVSNCNTGFTVTCTIQPQGISASYTVTPQAAIVVSGPADISKGSQYTVINTIGQKTWSISQGTIDYNGRVTSLSGACGVVTITCTDSCGRTGSVTARHSNGKWVHSGTGSFPNYYGCFNCGGDCPNTGTLEIVAVNCSPTYVLFYVGGYRSSWGCANCSPIPIGTPYYTWDNNTCTLHTTTKKNCPSCWDSYEWVCASDPRSECTPGGCRSC